MNIESNYTGTFDELRGFNRAAQRGNPIREARVAEATQLWCDVREGRQDPWFLRQALAPTSDSAWRILCEKYPRMFHESMSSSDFSALTADVLDRMLLANYTETPMHWSAIAKRATLRDFRNVKRYQVDGAEGEFSSVAEGAGFDRRAISQPAPTEYAPLKYVAGAKINWEAVINDDLGIFTDLPARLARGGRRSIEKFVTRLYVDASGPHASLYTVGNANIVTSNPVLSVQALGTAFGIIYKMVDSDGEPIEIEEAVLVVGPSLYVTAENIMNQITVDLTNAGGVSNQTVRVNNWIIRNLRVVRNPQIPLIASSANGDTSWFIFANPNIGRPALEVGFLPGFDTPQLFQKAGNTARLGGGVDPMFGDFDTMSTEYKAVMVYGGTRLSAKATVASNGSGS